MTKERKEKLQAAAKAIADHAAKLPEVCDFIGEVQQYAFSKMLELEQAN